MVAGGVSRKTYTVFPLLNDALTDWLSEINASFSNKRRSFFKAAFIRTTDKYRLTEK